MPIAVPGVYGGNVPNDVVAFRERLIAVGGVNGGCCDGGFSKVTQALVWTSPDGAEWRLAQDFDVFDFGHMAAVAANDADIVAVGTLNLKSKDFPGAIDIRPAVWTSQDGERWTLLRDVPTFVDVVNHPAGFLAVAQTDAGPEVWRSTDGSEWERLTSATELGAGEARRVVASPLGYLILGTEPSTEEAVVWRSNDGTSWDRAPSQGSFSRTQLEDGTAIHDRWIVVGWNDDAPSRSWTSTDGLSWEAGGDVFGVEDGTVRRAIVSNGTLLASGLDYGAGDPGPAVMASWTSVDGASWSRVPEQPERCLNEINDWVIWGEAVVAVGRAEPRNPDQIVGPGACIIR